MREKWHVARLHNIFWRFLSVIFPKGEKLAERVKRRREKKKRKGPRMFPSKKLCSRFFNIIMVRFIGGCDSFWLHCFNEKEDK